MRAIDGWTCEELVDHDFPLLTNKNLAREVWEDGGKVPPATAPYTATTTLSRSRLILSRANDHASQTFDSEKLNKIPSRSYTMIDLK